jgi:hypothetical protein
VRLVAELLTVPKKVMVCWVCMVFPLLLSQWGHIPKGAKESVTELSLDDVCEEVGWFFKPGFAELVV